MIVEHTYDNSKICYGCTHLKLDETGWTGLCECKDNKVKNRRRDVTDHKCSHKSSIG